MDIEKNKKAILDNLKWDERIVRYLVENDLVEVIQQKIVDNREIHTKLRVKSGELTLEDTFMT